VNCSALPLPRMHHIKCCSAKGHKKVKYVPENNIRLFAPHWLLEITNSALSRYSTMVDIGCLSCNAYFEEMGFFF